jgi:hypothetical protein
MPSHRPAAALLGLAYAVPTFRGHAPVYRAAPAHAAPLTRVPATRCVRSVAGKTNSGVRRSRPDKLPLELRSNRTGRVVAVMRISRQREYPVRLVAKARTVNGVPHLCWVSHEDETAYLWCGVSAAAAPPLIDSATVLARRTCPKSAPRWRYVSGCFRVELLPLYPDAAVSSPPPRRRRPVPA